MSGNRASRALRSVPLIAVVVCMFLVGGYAVVHHAMQGGDDTRRAAADTKPGATATASTTPSAGASRSASKAEVQAASATARLDQAVAGRSKVLKSLADRAQALSHKRKTARPVADFVFANFNVQGATHRGNVRGRTALARDLLNDHGVDVAALQEFTRSQQGYFGSLTGGQWGCYPCQSGPTSLDGENSVVWRKSRFDALKLETRPYPYFFGSIRNMPRVLLRDKQSGASFWVTSYHNAADVHGPAGKWRSIAVSRQIADNNAVHRDSKRAVIVSGDMNDRAAYFCKMAGGTGMHSADGSTSSGGCRTARSLWIDWVMGTSDVTFSGYTRDFSGRAHASSDHPVVVTRVKLKGGPGEGKYAER